ncbi:hydroxylase [Candidatus Poriferisocius sp.]|uniref:hydroxylase n=1 Tax=Candidatus Poriferisocius sp. TaxID=3101276 RepID=UPI003B02BEFD
MAHPTIEQIAELGPYLADRSSQADALGRLPDDTGKLLKETGVIRMLQPRDFGGLEADPRDFFNAVMDVGNHCPSAGWVAGVVGVHPWELALNDTRLQEEVWGEDPDTWVASPYAPSGIATPTDGGFIVNGRWSFSSGTDLCDWIVLGAMVKEASAGPDDPPIGSLHVMLPRADYQIVEDSWNTIGLEGTGSKDIIVDGSFVPDYRALDVRKLLDGRAAKESVRSGDPLFNVPWAGVFPGGVAAGLIGIAEGVLQRGIEYQAGRISNLGVVQADDHHSRQVLAEAASDIASARLQLVHNIGEAYDAVRAGHTIGINQRVVLRRDQVRAAWRAAAAANTVYDICGGNSIRLDKPVQRFWRGMHAGLHHGIFVRGPLLNLAGGVLMGLPPTGPSAVTV